MADLESVFPPGKRRRLLSVLGTLGVVLVVLALLMLGGARIGAEFLRGIGVPPDGARQIAFATVATIPPIFLSGLVVVTTDSGKSRLLGLGGIVLALTGIAIGLPFGFRLVGPLVALFYGGGLLLVLAAIGTGMVRDESSAADGSTGGVTVIGDPVEPRDGESMPADGGADEQELTFLLDEER